MKKSSIIILIVVLLFSKDLSSGTRQNKSKSILILTSNFVNLNNSNELDNVVYDLNNLEVTLSNLNCNLELIENLKHEKPNK